MFIAQIDFEVLEKFDIEKQSDAILWFLSNFYRDGRVLDENPVVFQVDNVLRTFASIPDKKAFDNIDSQKYIAKELVKLKELGLSQPNFQILGKDIATDESCNCKSTSAYILITHYFSIQSPIKCFDCLKPVPLYKIHQKEPEQLQSANAWQSVYKACDLLQIQCGFAERYGEMQMSKFESGLTNQGLKVCKKIEELTSKSCYYFLYKYRGISDKKERERKCPKCNGEWILEEKLHKLFDFKCDKCHLLGNIADSLR